VEEGPARLALQKAVDATVDFPGKDEARERVALLAINVGTANTGVRTELEHYLRKWPNDPAALMRLAQIQQRDGAVDQGRQISQLRLPSNARSQSQCLRFAQSESVLAEGSQHACQVLTVAADQASC
jgi:hypothetical protein